MQNSTQETKDGAIKNLFDFCDILDELGIVYWLDGGTLLGAYRDHDFCDGDEDDVDVFTWSNYQHLIPEVIKRAEAKGFSLHAHWNGDARAPGKAQEVALIRHAITPHGRYKLKVDFNFFEKKGDLAWGLAYIGPGQGIAQVCPSRFYEELGRITFYGREFNAPRDIEGYLTHRYGDFRTKIHRTVYSYTNPEQLQALHPDFVFWE